MINAFKQIRLTNVNISGQDGRISVANSGNLAFTSELENISGVLASGISSIGSSNNEALIAASGLLSSGIASTGSALDLRITSEVASLNSGLLAASGDLRSYVDSTISGVIDLAPDALNTLNELAAALGDDENFASNLTNTLTNISGALNSGIEALGEASIASLANVSGVLQSGIDTKVFSSTQKQFKTLMPIGTETSGISFPGDAFTSAPSVQTTVEGEVSYQTIIKNITASGFDVYFSDTILEGNTYLNVFASNQ
jgi:hypothetical protein